MISPLRIEDIEPVEAMRYYIKTIHWIDAMNPPLEKHTRDHEGENFIPCTPSNIEFGDQAHSVEIEIIADVATLYVDGAKVLSTFFDTEEIDRERRIGLNKPWIGSEVTFSEVRIRTPEGGASSSSAPEAEEFEYSVDTGTPMDYFPIESPYSKNAVVVDGEISSFEEKTFPWHSLSDSLSERLHHPN